MLSPGDKITIHVLSARGSTTWRATIEKSLGRTPSSLAHPNGVEAFRWYTHWDHGEVFDDDEGVKWIHGWLDESSDEVLALLAAAALVNDFPRRPFAIGDTVALGANGKLVPANAPQSGVLGRVIAARNGELDVVIRSPSTSYITFKTVEARMIQVKLECANCDHVFKIEADAKCCPIGTRCPKCGGEVCVPADPVDTTLPLPDKGFG